MARENPQRFPSTTWSSDQDTDERSMDTQYYTPKGIVKQEPKSSVPRTTTTTTARRNLTEIIDLITPPKPLASSTIENYKPSTIVPYNERRLSILPTYPMPLYGMNVNLLLANIPNGLLSAEQLIHRQPGKYICPFTINNHDPTMTSFILNQYHKFFVPILQNFKLDLSILDHNYARLQQVIEMIRKARLRALPSNKLNEDPLGNLFDNELPQLLEFYLQIDVDLFYMKTCSFNSAHPRSNVEGILCLTAPECLYTMSKCGSCELCTMLPSPVVFNHYQPHRFLNQYKSILNCPADCNTKNFIYVLTCVCNEYEYISETKFPLFIRLKEHCQIACNAIRSTLVGKTNLKAAGQQTSDKDAMLLYQHSSQCATAIRLFLERNPVYWHFVPLLAADVNQDNINFNRTPVKPNTTTNSSALFLDRPTQSFLAHIPDPPLGYKFADRQIEKQIHFFQNNIIKDPYQDTVYVFNAEIIAVMPLFSSDAFRRIIHALFVTHTESKLNTMGHIFNNSENVSIRKTPWCYNLLRLSTDSKKQFN